MARRLPKRLAAGAAAGLLALSLSSSVACSRADAEITTEVKTKIDSDRNLTSKMMQVDTKKGIVTLSGSAASDTERKRAEELARTTDGVKDIVDGMTINPALAPVPTDASGNAAAPTVVPAIGAPNVVPEIGSTPVPASVSPGAGN